MMRDVAMNYKRLGFLFLRVFLGVIIVICAISCVPMYLLYVNYDCEKRSSPPTIPIFPESMLTDSTSQIFSTAPRAIPETFVNSASYKYISDGSDKDIQAFYHRNGCNGNAIETLCISESS